MSSSYQNFRLVDSVASTLHGFRFGMAPANLIDVKSVVAAAIEEYEPHVDTEVFSLVTHCASEIRSRERYRQFQRKFSKPCWSRVTKSATLIAYDAAPLREPDYEPLVTVCSYPHASTADPWTAMQIFQGGQDLSLDQQLVKSLEPRATELFYGYGKMTVEGGSDYISPQRYTIFPSPDGRIDSVRIATGLSLLLADIQLEETYQTVLKETNQLLIEMRSTNPNVFSADPVRQAAGKAIR
jgi:hypothetical protein